MSACNYLWVDIHAITSQSIFLIILLYLSCTPALDAVNKLGCFDKSCWQKCCHCATIGEWVRSKWGGYNYTSHQIQNEIIVISPPACKPHNLSA